MKAKMYVLTGQLAGDIVFINTGFILAFLIRFGIDFPQTNFNAYLQVLPLATIAGLLIFKFYGLYNTYKKPWSEVAASILVSIFVLMIVTMAITYMSQSYAFPRSVILLGTVLQLILVGVWRWFMYLLELKIVPAPKVAIISPNYKTDSLVEKVIGSRFEVAAVATDTDVGTDSDIPRVEISNIKQLTEIQDLSGIVLVSNIPVEVKNELLHMAIEHNWRVYLIPELYEIMLYQSKLDQIGDTPVFDLGIRSNGRDWTKRLMDIALATVGLIITLPFMPLVALAIKIDSPGPIMYKQQRVTVHGRKFTLYKFRTMIANAENNTGPVLSNGSDDRITRIGRILRSTRADEIPQLLNVLKGEMSLVGPRPERPYFVAQFSQENPEYEYRHMAKPGITGLAQVEGKYSTAVDDKLRYDLIYTRLSSPLTDLQILFRTVRVLFVKDRSL